MRVFNQWFATFRESIVGWDYYTDFEKAYKNVNTVKDGLNLLNGLIGARDIEAEFRRIVTEYPTTLSVIPILLAKRTSEINILDGEKSYRFHFKKQNYSIDEYVMFMEKTGLFDLLQNHVIHSLIDYALGIEVGMDTNGRKSRTGIQMEALVESYLQKEGLIKGETYFKEMKLSQIFKKWGINLSSISNNGKTEKRFDFVVKKSNTVCAIETSFYACGGSKLNETARSYERLALAAEQIEGFKFIWITDGFGWKSARHNLEEAFDTMKHIYNFSDLENDILNQVLI